MHTVIQACSILILCPHMHPPTVINAVHNASMSVMKRLASGTVAASAWRFIAGGSRMVSLYTSLQGEDLHHDTACFHFIHTVFGQR